MSTNANPALQQVSVANVVAPAELQVVKPAKTRKQPAVKYDEIEVRPAGNQSSLYNFGKRLFDIAGALFFLALLSPVIVTTFAVLLITTKGNPFFWQIRHGYCGRKFRMYKFRTMNLNAAAQQHLVKNEKDGPIFKNRQDPRVTRVGRILRKFSIDEMPQLFNVLIGDMSLVGPRPPVPAEVAKYRAWQLARLAIKPGLTGLWQVSGRSDIGFEDMVRLDIRYSRRQSALFDLHLLVRTPLVVITGRGAY